MKDRILIIGNGVVGKNLSNELKKLDVSVYDKYKKEDNVLLHDRYDVGFICVDTPLIDGTVSTSSVVEAITENRERCDILVIKSTVPVGFTRSACRFAPRIVFSPEYYGGTQHCNNFDFNFTILGGKKDVCRAVQQVLQNVYDGRHRFHLVDFEVAEMVKFMENSWLATKVTFCCEFFRACNKAGISYEEVRELFLEDPRVNPSHTFVYEKHPYYDTHCLNKDVPSIANQFDIGLLKSVININTLHKG